MPVKSLWGSFSSTDSISLFWTKPDGYQSTYSYRVQTNITSPSTLISNIKVTGETATIPNLTPGETYTFTVFTTAADNVTKSDPVSLTPVTRPFAIPDSVQIVRSSSGDAMDITFQGFDTPNGPVVAYAVILTTDLSGNEPSKRSLSKTYNDFRNGLTRTYVTSVIGPQNTDQSNQISVHVGDGAVSRGYVNGPLDPTLQYRVYIVGFIEINYDPATDIINEDQSTPTVTNLSGSTSTSTTVRRGKRGHAEIPGSVQIVRSSSKDAMDITFQGFKSPSGPIVAYAIIMTTEFHGGQKPTKGSLSKTYNDFKKGLTRTYVTSVIEAQNIQSADKLNKINVHVGDGTVSRGYVNGPLDPTKPYRVYIVGFRTINFDPATNTINEDQSTAAVTSFSGSSSTTSIFRTGTSSFSGSASSTSTFRTGHAEISGSVQIVRSSSRDAMDITFQGFKSPSGPIVAYAIIMTTDLIGNTPTKGSFSKTYNDFKNRLTSTYVTSVIEPQNIQKADQLNNISVHVGDGTVTRGYLNGPLDPTKHYRVYIVGFTSIKFDPATNTINEDQSTATVTSFSGSASTTSTFRTDHAEMPGSVQIVRSASRDAMDITFPSFKSSSGPIVAYAIIMTTDIHGNTLTKGSLSKTYNDFKNGLTRSYVTSVIEQQNIQRNQISVHVGDGTVSRGYVNGALDPTKHYRVYIVGFTAINFDPTTNTINEDQSTSTVSSFSGSASTTSTFRSGHAEIPGSVQIVRSSSRNAMDITFQSFKTPSGPIVAYAIIMTTDLFGNTLTKGSLAKTYNDFKNGLTSTYVTSVIEPQNIQNADQLNQISVHVGDGTVSKGYVNGPLDPTKNYRVYIVGFTAINFDPTTNTINEDQSTSTVSSFSGSASTTSTFRTGHAEIPGSVQIVRSPSRDAMDITFQSFKTPSGPIVAYAIIMTTDLFGNTLTKGSLTKTYNDFKIGLTSTYVTSVIEPQNIQNADQLNQISVHVGDGTVSRGYVNGPLDPTKNYRVYIVGFTAINFDPTTNTINEDQSTSTVSSFSGSASTTSTFRTGHAEMPGSVQIVRSPSRNAMDITFQSFKTPSGPIVAYAIIMTTDLFGNTLTKGSLSKTYNDFKNGLTSTYVTSVIEPQNIQNADQLNQISVHVGDSTVSRGYVNGPLDPTKNYRVYIVGFTAINFDPATNTINEDQSTSTVSSFSGSASTTSTFRTGHAEIPGSMQIVRSPSRDAMDITFQSFKTLSGPIVAYAIIMTTDLFGNTLAKGSLAKTYNDFKNGLTSNYVTSVIEHQNIQNADQLNQINVHVGDGTVSRGYVNGPLDPAKHYRVYIVGFTAINFDPATGAINEAQSTAAVTSFSGSASTTSTFRTGHAEIPGSVQIFFSPSKDAMDINFQSFKTPSGPIVAYAIIMTTELHGNTLTKGSLSKTYSDFKNGLTSTYVTSVIEPQNIQNADQLNQISVHVGDGTVSRGYVNGPLDPTLHYRVYIVGFTAINYDPATDTINEDQSTAAVTSLSGSTSTTSTFRTGHAETPGSVQIVRSSSRDAMDITFQGFKSPSGPIVAYAIIMTTDLIGNTLAKGSLAKTYNDFKNGLTTTYVTSVIEQQNIQNADQLNQISVHVGDGTVSKGYVNGPLDPAKHYRVYIVGFTAINFDPVTNTINEDQSTVTVSSFSGSASTTSTFRTGHAEIPGSVQIVRSPSRDAMDITFQRFKNPYGPIVGYAIIMTTDLHGHKPTKESLSKTYNDFKNGLTRSYVTSVIEQQNIHNTDQSNQISVHVGDGTVSRGYVNGPLDPTLNYRVYIVGFTAINFDPTTNTINEDQSTATISSFSGSSSTSSISRTEHAEIPGNVQIVRSSSRDAMNITFQSFETPNGPIVGYAIIMTTDLHGHKPTKGSLSKTYNDFKNGLTRSYVTSVVEPQNIQNTEQSKSISVLVGDGSFSKGYVNAPLDPALHYRVYIVGFTAINFDPTTNTINEDQSTATISSFSGSSSTSSISRTEHAEIPGNVQIVRSSSRDAMNITFQSFETPNGPIVAYAIIMTTDLHGHKPTKGSLSKTYNDFKNGLTRSYVTSVVEPQNIQNTEQSKSISVLVGDGSFSKGYVNAPLDPALHYRVYIVGFTAINFDPTTNTINEDQSTATIASFSGSSSTSSISRTEHAEIPGNVQIVRSSSRDAMNITFQSLETPNGPIVAYAIIMTTDIHGHKPTKGSLSKTYNDFKNGLTRTYVTSVVEPQNIQTTDQSKSISVLVGDGSVSRGYVNAPLDPTLNYRVYIVGFTGIIFDPTTNTINEDQSTATVSSFSGSSSTSSIFRKEHAEIPGNVQIVLSSSRDAMNITFQSLETPVGPIVAYAIIMTTDLHGHKLTKGSLSKTYNDFKNGLTRSYVTSVVEPQNIQNIDQSKSISVLVGDGSVSRGYINAPLDPTLHYRVYIVGFTAINFDPTTNTINEAQSTATVSSFSGSSSTSSISRTEHAEIPGNVQIVRSSSRDAMNITFQSFETPNQPVVAYAIIMTTDLHGHKPTKGSLSKTYNDFKNGLTRSYVTSVVEPQNIQNTDQSKSISVLVGDGSVSRGYLNAPLDPTLHYRVYIVGFTAINFDPATDTINEDQSTVNVASFSGSASSTSIFRTGHAEIPGRVQMVRSSSGDAMDITFQSFETSNGPIVAYAVILTTDLHGHHPTKGSLSKTYNDFKNGLTRSYVTSVIEQQNIQNTDQQNQISVHVGDGTVSRGYVNGPLDPTLNYRVYIVGFTAINFDPTTNTINENQSTATSFSASTTSTFKTDHAEISGSVQIVRSPSRDALNITFQSFETSNGPIVAYAIIMTTDLHDHKLTKESLSKTYTDFKNGLTRTYVTSLIEQQNIQNTDQSNKINVHVGDGTVSRGYINGPLDSALNYRVYIAGFTAINFDPASNTINENQSTATVASFSGSASTSSTFRTEHAEIPGSVQIVRSLSRDAMNITFQSFETPNGPIVAYAIIMTTDLHGNKPIEGSLSKTYNDFKNGLTRTYVSSVIEQKNIHNTDQSNKISVRVGDGTVSRGYVNGPLDPTFQYRVYIVGFTAINFDPTTHTINEDQSTAIVASFSGSASTTTFRKEMPGSVQIVRSSSRDAMNITFQSFETSSGPIEAYAIIVTTDLHVVKPTKGSLSKTYNDFKNGLTRTYVTSVIEQQKIQNADQLNKISVHVGDGTVSRGYVNGPLDPTLHYRVYIVGFSTINFDPATNTINEDQSTATVASFSGSASTTSAFRTDHPEIPGSVQIVRSSSRDAMNITFQGFETPNGPILAYAIIMTTDLSGSKPAEGSLSKTYNDFKNGLTSTYVSSVIEQQNIPNTDQVNKISVHVGDGTVSRGYVNGPLDPTLHYRVYLVGFTDINYDPATGTINEDQSTAAVSTFSGSTSTTSTFRTEPVEIPGNVQIVRSSLRDAMNITFQSYETPNGPIVAYAIIMTTDLSGNKPTQGSLAKTYNDFRYGLTRTYVTSVIEQQNIQNSDQSNKIIFHVGDGTVSRGYFNGPLDPALHYRAYVVGFTAINYDPATDIINEDQSIAAVTSFSISTSTTTTGPAEVPSSVQVVRSFLGDVMNITFQSFDTQYGPTVAYAIIMTTDLSGNKPIKGSLSKTYNDFKNGLASSYVTSVIEQQNIQNTDQLNQISVRVGDGTVSRGYVNGPLDPTLQYRVYVVGFTSINYDPTTDTINEDQSTATLTSFSGFASTTTTITTKSVPTEIPGSVQIVRSSSGDALNVTFQSFDTSYGPTVAYAIILTIDLNGNKPTEGSLSKTYSDFKNGLTRTYVTSIIENIQKADQSNKISVRVGDGTVSRGYVNGPLDPALSYKVYIAGFTAINYDKATDTINGDKSTATVTSFYGSASTTTTITAKKGPAEIPGGVQVVRSYLGDAMNITFQSVDTSHGSTVVYAIIMTTDFSGNKPTKGSFAKTYNDFRNRLTNTYVTSVIEQQDIENTDQSNRINVRVGDGSVSRGYINGPLDPALRYRVYIVGFTAINYDPATNTINEEQSTATLSSCSGSASTTTTFETGHAEKPGSLQTVRSSSGDAMNITLQSLEPSFGPTEAYAIIMTTDFSDNKPTKGSLAKTYNDFKKGLTRTYVTSVIERQNIQKADELNKMNVYVGDGTVSRGYINGPLNPALNYRVYLVGFSTINYHPATGTINEDKSTSTFTSFSGSASKTTTTTATTTTTTTKTVPAEVAGGVQIVRSSTGKAMDITFQSLHTAFRPIVAYAIIMTTDLNGNKPTKGSLAKTYNDFRKGLTGTYVTSVIEQQKIRKATQLNQISIRVGDGTVSRGYVNGPLDPTLHYRVYIVGFTAIKYNPATNTINEDRSAATVTTFSDSASITTTTNIVLLEEQVNVQAVRSSSGDAMNITFQSFETSYGPTVAYAIIVTTDSNVEQPTKESLAKTYNDFINGLTTTYVTSVVEQQETQKASHENEISVNVGDGTVSRGYINGPLDPDLQYRVSIAGFSTINYYQATGIIDEDQSTAAVTSFSDFDLADLIEEPSIVQDVRSSLNEVMDTGKNVDISYHSAAVSESADNSGLIGGVVGGIFGAVALAGLGFLIWRKRRQSVGYQKNVLISPITGDVKNLYEEPEVLSAVSCTTAAQALMEVETGSARTMERHKSQGTKTEEWNLGVLVSDKQKYSRQTAGYAKPLSIRQNSGDVTYMYEETELTKEATRTSTFKASHQVEKESARRMEEHKYEGAETEDWNMEVLTSENLKYSGQNPGYAKPLSIRQNSGDVTYMYDETKLTKEAPRTSTFKASHQVEKESARRMEEHKYEDAETEDWNMEALTSENLKYSGQHTSDVEYSYKESKMEKASSCTIPVQAPLAVAKAMEGRKRQESETEEWNVRELVSEKQKNRRQTPGYEKNMLIRKSTGDVRYLFEEPKVMKAVSCIIPLQADLEVNTESVRVTAGHKGQITETEDWNMEVLLSEKQIYSRKQSVKIENFHAAYQRLRTSDYKGLILEFDSLKCIKVLQSRAITINLAKTQKKQLDAVEIYETSHARTSALEGSIYGYISASYIAGYRFSREFIAAQNPQSDTVGYFWYLIWEKHINTIVMLSSCEENGKECSEQYWPSREAKVFGDIMVTFVSEDIHRNGTVRNLLVTNLKSSESRQVRQFQYTLWTTSWDFIDRDILMKFVSSVQQYRKKNSPNYPTMVHCSSGACRSGIFIALDWIITQLKEESSVDVYGIAHCLNQQRPLMVHTAAHYMFLYQCTLELIIRQTEDISGFYEYYEQVKEESV
ncbi:uncharacterized protein LOC143929620 isoform X1 [Lithobates pipiens]